MEDNDLQNSDFPMQDAWKSRNDPWAPVKNTPSEIPKIVCVLGDPLKTIISSDAYLKSLEKRLDKIKGKTDGVKPKDMIKSLHKARDLHISQLMLSDFSETQCDECCSKSNESVMAAINRRLNPEKQAVNAQELVPLVHEDVLSRTIEQDDRNETDEGTEKT